jgi:hypothetical protein
LLGFNTTLNGMAVEIPYPTARPHLAPLGRSKTGRESPKCRFGGSTYLGVLQ